MEDREKKLEELIRSMAEDTGIPASIHPDAMEKKLEAVKTAKKRKLRRAYIAAAAAACLCVAVGLAGGYTHFFSGNPGAADMSSGSADSAAGAGGSEDAGTANSASAGAEISGENLIASAEDYDEIYEYIQAEREQDGTADGFDVLGESGAAADTGASASSIDGAGVSSQGNAGNSYSDTNVREEGVGEADIVKTDGGCLYIVNGQTVEIVGIESAEMEELSEIRLADDCYVAELYVQDDRLVILYTRTEYDCGENGYAGAYRDYTCAVIYDISDRTNPVKAGNISQSGSYNTMRVRDGYVYVLSNFYADMAAAREETHAYIPEVQGNMIEASDIYMPQRQMGSQYTVISSISLDDPTEKADSIAVFGNSGICYVSTENIYITEIHFGTDDSEVNQTSIRKISYENGMLEGVAQTKVDGTLNDSFSIDEYEGYLRLVTTISPGSPIALYPMPRVGTTEEEIDSQVKDTNALYVLDENLTMVGEIRDLAEDESV